LVQFTLAWFGHTPGVKVSVFPSGAVFRVVAGNGRPGFRDDLGDQDRFNKPSHLVRLITPVGAESEPRRYEVTTVADAASNTVSRKPVGGALQTVTMAGTLAVPHGVASDAAGNLYVAEIRGHRVSKISPSGEVSVVAGTGEAGAGPDQLNRPAAVLVHDSLLWIADLENHRILTLPVAP